MVQGFVKAARESLHFILLKMRSLRRTDSRAVHALTCILERSLWLLRGKGIERVKGKSHVTSLEDPSRQAINKPSLQTRKNQMCRKIVWKKIHQKM